MTCTTAGKGRVLSSTYEWEIDNYTSYSDLEPSQYIYSPSFNVHSVSWHLKMYPNGENEEAQKYISLFLFLNRDEHVNVEVRAQFAFTFLDSRNKTIAVVNSQKIFVFNNTNSGYGTRLFANKSFLENTENIKTLDKITIVCEFIIEEAKLYKPILTISQDRMQHFQGLENLLDNPKFSDVKFTVENKEILAHKMMLTANSTVFAAMFEHQMRENEENIVSIEDISYDVFKELLVFVYAGECTLSDDILIELFEAADKYQLLKLKSVCEEKLCKNISVENVMIYLQLADMHSTERLKKEAIDYIASHGKDMIDKPEFELVGDLNTKLLKDVFREVFSRIA